jgi:predicted phage baseplate assembly protein
MPIEPPRLDDLTYDRVREDLLRRIPVYAPEWTDHNDSDPGVTLIQLFGHLAEMLGYRLNRVPEANHIQLLKILGVRLEPARAAHTTLAFLLSNPATATAFTLPRGARAKTAKGDPPPVFETDEDVDIVPAEIRAIVTTKNPDLRDVLLRADGTRDPVSSVPDKPKPNETEWLAVAWDGATPKLKDLPVEPVNLAPRRAPQQHAYVWIGLDFNAAPPAGFRGTRVTLSIQLDDDEQPAPQADIRCETPAAAREIAPPPIEWLAYYDADRHEMRTVPGRIVDGTGHLQHSGPIRFTVPPAIGPIPEDEFADLRPEVTVSPVAGCTSVASTLRDRVLAGTLVDVNTLPAALTTAINDAQAAAAAVKPPVPHPLDAKLRKPDKLRGWLRIELNAPLTPGAATPRIRMITFNAAPATNATWVAGELLGTSDGRPGQSFRLVMGNVVPGSLRLAVQESADAATPLVDWTEAATLDAAGPFDRVFSLDAEAGIVSFGDARNGRVPPLAPRGGQIVALRYRAGGGKAGETAPGTITSLETQTGGLSGVTNPVAATGGADAETLEEAKRRARKELSTRSRAVTAEDFEWFATRTLGVRVGRAHVVPLRVPLAPAAQPAAVPAPRCGPALPTGTAGLDSAVAPGAVTVVVVPDEDGAGPVPTPSFLRAVCRQLDAYRLVTTELHVVPPQYCRICKLFVSVKARPGYTRARLQELVEARLSSYLHVLRGAEDGKGFPFGAQVHVADLIAQAFRTEGVERVEDLRAEFTRTKSNAVPREGQLRLCPTGPGEQESVQLGDEETVSFDASSLTLSTVV